MKTKRTAKLFLIFLVIIFSTQFAGCGIFLLPSVAPQEVTDPTIREQVLDFDFAMTKKKLFGDMATFFDAEVFDEMPKTATVNAYLTEYFAPDNGFYLVYMPIEYVDDCIKFLDDNLWQIRVESSNSYRFTENSEERVVDGKYLFAYLRMGGDTSLLKVCKANSLMQLAYHFGDGYQLVHCSKTKRAVIRENVNTQETLNKEITVYARHTIRFYQEVFTPFIYGEYLGWIGMENDYNFEGMLLTLYPNEYETMDFTCLKVEGWRERHWQTYCDIDVIIENGQMVCVLPNGREGFNGDFFTGDKDALNNKYNVFGSRADLFEAAYIRPLTDNEGRSYSYWDGGPGYTFGLYDYYKVCEIIRTR